MHVRRPRWRGPAGSTLGRARTALEPTRLRSDPTRPAGEHDNVDKALAHAKYRLKEGQDSLDMPDMSNCVIS